jgi:hypothetical protein
MGSISCVRLLSVVGAAGPVIELPWTEGKQSEVETVCTAFALRLARV